MVTPQVDQLKLAMSATNELFCAEVVGKQDFAALDHVYTLGARILPPGAPMISGREEIKAFWAGMVQSTNAKSVTLSSVEVIPAGDGIVEIGRATLTFAGSPDALEAKYVVYWRQEDGRWKWDVDIWNPNS
jgi:ketosteroid isomerase-like protein